MIETLGRWLVQQPWHIVAIWVLLRATILRAALRANVVVVPAILCLASAAWGWLLLRKSPEADIRPYFSGRGRYLALATVCDGDSP